MRRDFHFHVIYVLLRAAGMQYDKAYKTAYASEHVDNSKEEDVICFESGGQTQTIQSAHEMLSAEMYTDKTGMAIYMPFHFFPCLEGHDFKDRIECKPNSLGIKELKKELNSHLKEAYGPHLLGVVLHVIADTYAHKHFNALNDERNTGKHIEIENAAILDLIYKRLNFVPPFGHLQVFTCPDEPACIWSYIDYKGDRVARNNPNDFIEAAEDIYNFLTEEIRTQVPNWFGTDKPLPFHEIKDKLYKMLNLNMTHTNRLNEWDRMWDLGFFDFKKPHYNKDKWFKKAIICEGDGIFKTYDRTGEYGSSDWKLFQDALSHHDFYCKRKIFPKYGIYI